MAFCDRVRPLCGSETTEFEVLTAMLLNPNFFWDCTDVSKDRNAFVLKGNQFKNICLNSV